jgi:erythromycin esterase-like protein
MSDTIDRISHHHGAGSKGMVWAHNTHVGDARATDMAQGGMDNIGQLMRQRHPGQVFLVGFASHAGTVTAADEWGSPEQTMPVPPARQGSHEDLLNQALAGPGILMFGAGRSEGWLTEWRGHRAIGVVYHPDREGGNYVPTRMAGRYDALLWIPQTTALRPLHHEQQPGEPEFETEPTGF